MNLTKNNYFNIQNKPSSKSHGPQFLSSEPSLQLGMKSQT